MQYTVCLEREPNPACLSEIAGWLRTHEIELRDSEYRSILNRVALQFSFYTMSDAAAFADAFGEYVIMTSDRSYLTVAEYCRSQLGARPRWRHRTKSLYSVAVGIGVLAAA